MRLCDDRAMARGNGDAAPPSLACRAAEVAPAATRSSPWLAERPWAIFLATLYPLLIVAPLAIFVALNPQSDHAVTAEMGIDCAVVGFTIVATQFVMGARLAWIEAPFGLDVLMAFHRAMGLIAAVLLCAHPVLVASAEGWQLLTRLHAHWYIWAGRVAVTLLLVHVTVALLRQALHLSYERWRRIHNVFAIAILSLGFAHSLAVGDDLHGGGLATWIAIMSIAVG